MSALNPDSPDEMALGRLRAPISIGRSNSYAGSSSRILTDPTGERRSQRFRQHFRGLRSCRPNPSGGSGTRSLPRSSGSASKPPTIRIHQQPSRHDPQSRDSPLDGVRAEPAARALFRTSTGSQSVKLGSAQSIVRPISEFATGPLRPRYNITPTTTIDVIRLGEHGHELVPMSWGLIALNV